MNRTTISKILTAFFAAVLCFGPVGLAETVGTAFTYQGQLIDANNVANGLYDFQFKLYDSDSNGNKVGIDVNVADLDVLDGFFTAVLDFNDANAFEGDARWLQISVRPGNLKDPNVYTVLEPRQEVKPTPYSLYSKSTGSLQTSGDLVLRSGNGNVDIGDANDPANLNNFGEIRIYRNSVSRGGRFRLGIYPVDFNGSSYGNPSELEWNFGDAGSNENICMNYTSHSSGANIALCPDGLKVWIGAPNKAVALLVTGSVDVGDINDPANLNNFGDVRIYRKSAGGLSRRLGTYPADFNGSSYGYPGEIEFLFSDGNDNTGVYYTSAGSGAKIALCPDGNEVLIGGPRKAVNLVVTGSVDVGDTNNPANLNNFGDVRIYRKYASGLSGRLGVYPTDFTGSSYGEPSEMEWDFGNGERNAIGVHFTSTGSDSNMAIVPDGGTLRVGALNKKTNLIVTGSVDVGDTNNAANLNNFGDVRIYRKSVSGLSRRLGVYPVDYDGASYGEPSEIEWDFGDGEKNAIGVHFTSTGSDSNMAIVPDGGTLRVGALNKRTNLIVTGKLNIGDTNNPTDMEVTGKLGIGTTSPTEKLDVAGTARIRDINFSGDPNAYTVVCDATGKLFKKVSSQRYKTDVRNLDADTDAVLKLRPVRFQWKTTGQQDVGLIAEEVEKVSKDLVIYDGDGKPDGVNYDKVAVYLLSVVKNQQVGKEAAIESLQKENTDIKARLEAMESLVAKLSVQQEGGVR